MNTMSEPTVDLDLSLIPKAAWALAEFVKRLQWTQIRACAVNDEEADLMKQALVQLQKTLNQKGFSPR
jgi:hypothetical protein